MKTIMKHSKEDYIKNGKEEVRKKINTIINNIRSKSNWYDLLLQ